MTRVEKAIAAAQDRDDPPLTQQQADWAAALLTSTPVTAAA